MPKRTVFAVLIAIGVNAEGHREILGICAGMQEVKESWLSFVRHLKSRGLWGVRLVVSDKCLGLVEAVSQCYPKADWQRCVFHFHRNILAKVSREKMAEVAPMLKAIHAQEDREAAMEKGTSVKEKRLAMRLGAASKILEAGLEESLSYMSFPREHRIPIRTNNAKERLNREIRRRARVVGNFPDGQSALMLVATRPRHVAATQWGTRRYLDMDRFNNLNSTKEE